MPLTPSSLRLFCYASSSSSGPAGISDLPSTVRRETKILVVSSLPFCCLSESFEGSLASLLTGKMKSSEKLGFVTFLLAFELMQVPAYSTYTIVRHYVNHDSQVFQKPSTLPISRMSRLGIASFQPDWRSMSKFCSTARFSRYSLLSIFLSYCWLLERCVHWPFVVGVCPCFRVDIRLGSFQLLKISLLVCS